MGGVGAPDALRPGFAQPEITDLTLFDEPGHCTDRILDRHCRIDPVLVIKIDDIDAEPLQARLARLDNIGEAPVDAVGAARPARLAEFGHDDEAVAPALQCPAEEFLVLAPAIHVRAVEMVDAELDRPVDHPDPGLVVALAVDPGQRHAAETDSRDLRPRLAEPPALRDSHAAHRSLQPLKLCDKL